MNITCPLKIPYKLLSRVPWVGYAKDKLLVKDINTEYGSICSRSFIGNGDVFRETKKISNSDLNTYISLGYKVRRLYISDLIILLLHYTQKAFKKLQLSHLNSFSLSCFQCVDSHSHLTFNSFYGDSCMEIPILLRGIQNKIYMSACLFKLIILTVRR